MQRSTLFARRRLPSGCMMWLLFVLPTPTLFAEGPRYPISTLRVAQALVGYGLKVTPEEIRLPAMLSATSASPQLELVSMRPAAAQLVQLELRCHAPGECLPFFVLLNVPAGAVQSLVAAFKNNDKSPQPETLQNVVAGQAAPKSIQPTGDRMRVGASITLLLEDGQMRIQFPAVALDSGAPGSIVRVSTIDRRKTFRATVVSPTIAEGDIE